MNILPKKSWHVRNKDNVARVRRDEAQAAEEERQRRKRAELAEQEARTDFLRKKSRLSLPETSPTERSAAVELSEESGHINFFQNVEEGKGVTRGNKEYEEEKRKEKERQEKAMGILTYLGQSAAEAQTCPPWYQEVPAHRKEKAETAKDDKLKRMLDPMNEMEKYLRKKTGEKKRHSDKKKHKKAKEKADKKGASKPSMEQLRQERLKREAAERARAAALLSGKKEPAAPEQEMDDRKRRYNSQFNPQLARKPKVQEEQR